MQQILLNFPLRSNERRAGCSHPSAASGRPAPLLGQCRGKKRPHSCPASRIGAVEPTIGPDRRCAVQVATLGAIARRLVVWSADPICKAGVSRGVVGEGGLRGRYECTQLGLQQGLQLQSGEGTVRRGAYVDHVLGSSSAEPQAVAVAEAPQLQSRNPPHGPSPVAWRTASWLSTSRCRVKAWQHVRQLSADCRD
jgi:hypothetical protein